MHYTMHESFSWLVCRLSASNRPTPIVMFLFQHPTSSRTSSCSPLTCFITVDLYISPPPRLVSLPQRGYCYICSRWLHWKTTNTRTTNTPDLRRHHQPLDSRLRAYRCNFCWSPAARLHHQLRAHVHILASSSCETGDQGGLETRWSSPSRLVRRASELVQYQLRHMVS